MKILKRQKPLTNDEMELLINLHANHMKRLGNTEQILHSFDNIKSVYRDIKNKSFNVTFNHGEWYHYCINGQVF